MTSSTDTDLAETSTAGETPTAPEGAGTTDRDEAVAGSAAAAESTPDAATPTDADTPVATDTPAGADNHADASSSTASDAPAKENPLEAEAEIAADYLEELLDIADLDGDIDTYIDNGRAQVSIVTDSNVLVGPDGEVLEALQELVRLAVMAETDGRTRLMLDVAGFRDKRRATLKDLANDAIQEVKDSGEPVRMAPMNPFERKIIHDVVAEGGLNSESEGAEPHRRVVVLPA